MLFADWAPGLTHSIRAIKGHCSTGGEKTCFVGIPLNTQSVHKDSQKHTWHTKTPRHQDTHTYTMTCQLPCCTEKSFKFCQPHFPQNSPYIPWNLLSTWSQRQSPHPSEPLATISSVSDWVRATMVIIILTFHHIPFIAFASNYAVEFALKTLCFLVDGKIWITGSLKSIRFSTSLLCKRFLVPNI